MKNQPPKPILAFSGFDDADFESLWCFGAQMRNFWRKITQKWRTKYNGKPSIRHLFDRRSVRSDVT